MTGETTTQTPVAKPWVDSKTIRSLAAALLYWALLWTSVSLSAGTWDWKYLAAGALAIVIPAVKRMADADVIAPIDVLNRAPNVKEPRT